MFKELKLVAIIAMGSMLVACGKPNVVKLESTDKILVVGDDISVGSGGKGISFPEELGPMIGNWIVNESVVGNTSTKLKDNLSSVLDKQMPSHLMIVIGGIDMQQKIPDSVITENLDFMLVTAKENNVIPIVVGMPRPSTPGTNLKLVDAAFYKEVASKNDVVYIENTISDILDQPNYKSSPTLLTGDGYKELAKSIAHKMKEFGFVTTVKE